MGGLAPARRGSSTRPTAILLALIAALLLPTLSSEQQPRTLYVNSQDPTCQGLTPCYGTIQAAVDAAQPGDTIRIQAGTYPEQVSIQGKNNFTGADEPDRIVIEADPAAAPGSVVLRGTVAQCTNGHAIRLRQSKFITIRGLTITGAGGQAISLPGGIDQNQAIHLERNRIFGNGSPECNGGITIARGNPGTLIINNLIYGNGRNGITLLDADGGPHHLIENTLHANQWNGIRVARSHEVVLVNNILTGNGTATGTTGGRFGVSREDSTSPQPEGIHLLHNLICGNRLGEINGPALDPTDANNLTPTGSEGSGVLASAGCDLPATVYANLNGPDGLPNTADDDFTLAAGSPAIDHGLDPRTLGLDLRFNPLLEADYAAAAARPRDGDQNGTAGFDLGALEFAPEGLPPTITALSPTSAAAGSTISPFTVTGTNLGGATRLDFLREDGTADPAITSTNLTASADGTTLTATVRIDASAVPGSRVVTVTTTGGTSSSTATPENTFTVLPPVPTITGFTPTSGKVGATVTISGSHFRPTPSENTVTFTGADNTRVSTPVSAATATSLTVTVPAGAVTGPLAVTTTSGTATSAGHFVVLASPDFTLTASPANAQAVPGSNVAFALRAVPRDGFTGLVSLSVSGLPAGATATFSPPTLGPSQGGTLSIATGATASGSFPLTVSGTATIEGTSVSHSVAVSLTILAAGQTSLVGRILDTAKQPVPGVTIQIGALTTTTDAAGNFTLLNPPTGTQIVFLDGRTASTADRSYPTIPVTVTITAGQVNTLPFQPHFHVQKARNFTDIGNSAVARTVTDPEVPGFALTVPAGVTITGWDGQPNTQISVQPIPRDRLPLPPPPGGGIFTSVFMFYFGKTGGGTPSAPIPITVPNDIGALPGETLDLFYFDDSTPTQAHTNAWQLGGTGTVTADGKQIVTTSGGIRQFCCGGAAFRRPPPPAPSRPPQGASAAGGEPVDLSTGLFILEKTDLLLPGRLPVVLTRTYRTLDTSAGPFGPGTSHPYEISLQPRGTDLLLLTLPGNSRSLWGRETDGRFRNDQVPAYRGAQITANPDGTRTLRWKDGSTWRFDSNGRLIAQADRNGNTVTITRDGQGRASGIAEPGGRSLTLTYDGASLRVSSVTDPIGRTVQYAYDGSGRLTRVTDPAGE